MKNKKMNVDGITLIALIITIIVLLILAGVTIALLTGENGILGKAGQASDTTKDITETEHVNLAVSEALINGTGKLSTENVKNALKNEFGEEKVIDNDTFSGNGPWTFKGERKTYTIGTNGEIEEEKSDISISLTIKGTPIKETDIPIPDGFVYVGGSINEGYVISDNSADKDKGADSEELQGNQFVWVPVEKDQKITAKVSSKEEITSIVLTDPFGDKILEESNKGTTYNKEIEPTINGEYKIKVTTSKGETSKTLEVYSLYAQNLWQSDELFLKQIEEEAKAQDMTVEQILDEYFNGMSLEEILAMVKVQYKTMYKETEDYKNNVNKNGGFYIGRYEAGDSSKTSNDIKGNGELVTQKNKYVYNSIIYSDALTKAKAYNENAKSSLLTIAARDRTLGWLYETGNKTIEEIALDSTSWGNYSNDTFSETKELIKTGQFEQTKANNIYDLAGNVGEWLTEYDVHEGFFCDSGGRYAYNGSMSSISQSSLLLSSSKEIGFRLVLYMQD